MYPSIPAALHSLETVLDSVLSPRGFLEYQQDLSWSAMVADRMHHWVHQVDKVIGIFLKAHKASLRVINIGMVLDNFWSYVGRLQSPGPILGHILCV